MEFVAVNGMDEPPLTFKTLILVANSHDEFPKTMRFSPKRPESESETEWGKRLAKKASHSQRS